MKKQYIKLIEKRGFWYKLIYILGAIFSCLGFIASALQLNLMLSLVSFSLICWHVLRVYDCHYYECNLNVPDLEEIGIYLLNQEKYACSTEEEAFIHAELLDAVPVFLENVKKFKQ